MIKTASVKQFSYVKARESVI